MDRHEIERKLPTMSQTQLIDTVKTCLDMIERLEGELAAGARKQDDMTSLVRKLTESKGSHGQVT
jgi:hypothetical protein